MPSAPLRYCASPGCPVQVTEGRCPAHKKQLYEKRHNQGATAYNRVRWMRLRDRFRAEHPFCVNVKTEPRCTQVTEVVDHIRPHLGDEALMYDESNLAGMCWSCHSRKTAAEVGFAGKR